MGGGGKGGGSVSIPAPPPPPPVQEDFGADKSSLYSDLQKKQSASSGRRATILTGSSGDETDVAVRKRTLLGG